MNPTDFDFERLNFKYDLKTRKIRMFRGYLEEFLRANGVMTLPGQQELVDLMANLYLMHRKQGRPAVPQMDAFLSANGMKIKEQDPDTISPARRQMDNSMDVLLLEARTRARQGASAADFWRWLDGEIAPIVAGAEEAGEEAAFQDRYSELMQLAKDAGLVESQ